MKLVESLFEGTLLEGNSIRTDMHKEWNAFFRRSDILRKYDTSFEFPVFQIPRKIHRGINLLALRKANGNESDSLDIAWLLIGYYVALNYLFSECSSEFKQKAFGSKVGDCMMYFAIQDSYDKEPVSVVILGFKVSTLEGETLYMDNLWDGDTEGDFVLDVNLNLTSLLMPKRQPKEGGFE
jgi:hypothetical protein